MKSIGAETLFLSVLMLLTALPDNLNGENENQTTIGTSTSSGILKTNTGAPNIIPTNTTSKTVNDSTPAPVPTLSSIRPSDNQTKNGTEATTKGRNTTAQYRPANTPSTVLTTGNPTTLNLTHATSNSTEIKPTDGKIEDNFTADLKDVVNLPDVSSNIMPTDHKGATEGGEVPSLSKSKKGIYIGVGCVLAAVVLVVLIFLYKMCQKKPPAAENREVKVSAQTKESVKLLSVKTATPYSDSKRMSPNQMESIEC
ncbi:endomucin [Eleutherodactylus coqui]|uniref:endomucin n=1 Tax=Eleutherodactylus coqui TaxID=57060 RepID=UPI0034617D0F